VAAHPDEALLTELRQRHQTPAGLAELRKRTNVDTGNAAASGKNLFDLRRVALVHHQHVIARQESTCQPAA
jgi:hypothetical protein